MATNTNLRIDGLEFNQIKENLKEYLKNQDQFNDYDFESSGLNVLIDTLAYNTYYNAFYANMATNETMLSTAQKRNSVVALANSLNYVPRSASSAKLQGRLTLYPSATPASINVPAGTIFYSNDGGDIVNFVTTSATVVFPTNGAYFIDNLILTEGSYVQETYTYDSQDKTQRFLINNPNADTSTLQVRVIASSTDTTSTIYTKSESVIGLDNESEVYFIKEVEDGKFEISFGDDILGSGLSDGNLVRFNYIVSKGSLGNGIKNVVLGSTIQGVDAALFVSNELSSGGQEPESIERIKFNAPKFYATQNRCVTAEDYAALVLQEPNVASAVVWGGEDNDPPTYGKVYIAIKPVSGEILTSVEKQVIIDTIINPKRVLTVGTEIVDPEYTYLGINITSNYNSDQTIATEADLQQTILNTVAKYNDERINQFSKYFRYSELTRLIDLSDRSILSTSMELKMNKEFDVQLNSPAKYVIDFSNAINDVTRGRPSLHPYGVQNQITSNEFSYGGFDNCFLEENNGIIRVYRISGNDNVGVSQNVGTVDYDSGKITLNDFRPTAIADGGVTLKIRATPRVRDIISLRGQIIVIRQEDVTVTLIDDKTISTARR